MLTNQNTPQRMGEDAMQAQIEARVLEAIPDAEIIVQSGGPGHYALKVVSAAFEGKNRVARQRLVLSALKPLMAGDSAPIHAIDTLITEVK